MMTRALDLVFASILLVLLSPAFLLIANRLLVPPRDPQVLADAIIELCRDSDLRERMGAESRRIAVDRFDATVVAADICDALSL